jgi:hypothetical protein
LGSPAAKVERLITPATPTARPELVSLGESEHEVIDPTAQQTSAADEA